jgi:hypothetical protein
MSCLVCVVPVCIGLNVIEVMWDCGLAVLIDACIMISVVAVRKRVFVSSVLVLLCVSLIICINVEVFFNMHDFPFLCIIYYIHNVLDFFVLSVAHDVYSKAESALLFLILIICSLNQIFRALPVCLM